MAAPPLKKSVMALGKPMEQKALKAGVEPAHDYLGDNERNSKNEKTYIPEYTPD